VNDAKSQHPQHVKWLIRPIIFVATVPIVCFSGILALRLVFLDESYREGMYFSGEAKVIQHEFQSYFYGRETYPIYTLPELERRGILSPHAGEHLRQFHARYLPFGPETPPDAVVLRLRGGFLGADTIKFTKNELTRDPKL
jgi:hypothetical protein